MQATIRFFIEVFMWLAGFGVISVAVALGIAQFRDLPLANATATVLFPGIFVVWLPTVLVMTRLTRNVRRTDLWKVALSGCPVWMRRSLYTLILIGAAIFLFNVVLGGNRKDPPMIYFGAGHMFIFYGISFCILYSALHSPRLMSIQRCPNGHEISALDSFCPVCGSSITPARLAQQSNFDPGS